MAHDAEPTIFVSYRRSDSSGSSRVLVQELAARFGAERVFQDISDIAPGDDFPEAILKNLKNSTVVVAVIGPGWRGARRFGRSRIMHSGDWVRRELEAAAGLPATILPVLVNGAAPPKESELPSSLSYLATLNAQSLRPDRWDDDVEAFHQSVEQAHAKAGADGNALIESRSRKALAVQRRRQIFSGAGAAISVACLAGLAFWFWPQPQPLGAVSVLRTPAGSQALDIGFWNLKRLAGSRLESREDPRLDRVVNELVALNLDIYNLAEVDEKAVELLVSRMARRGIQVGALHQNAIGNMDLAVLFRRDRVQCSKDDDVYQANEIKLKQKDPATGRRAFPRAPLFYICRGGRLTSPVSVAHVHFKSMFGGQGKTQTRRQLASIILGEIMAGRKRAIVGGTFNAFPKEVLELFSGLEEVGKLVRLFEPGGDAVTWIGTGRFKSATLDYIWASRDLPIAGVGDGAYAVVRLDRAKPGYRTEVSDHLPLVLSISYEAQ
ncbi:MAG: TIR domain-containing protein [Pseudomonadota bacterium]